MRDVFLSQDTQKSARMRCTWTCVTIFSLKTQGYPRSRVHYVNTYNNMRIQSNYVFIRTIEYCIHMYIVLLLCTTSTNTRYFLLCTTIPLYTVLTNSILLICTTTTTTTVCKKCAPSCQIRDSMATDS